MEYEVESPRPRGRPKRTWREVVKEDCQAHKLNTEDVMDRSKWRKLIKDVRWPGWVWVGECFFWYRPTRVVTDQRPLKGCVCVVRNYPGQPVSERYNQSGLYWSKRQWVAVAPDRPYASLHLSPDRWLYQHPSTQFFYTTDALPATQPTASKHLRHNNTQNMLHISKFKNKQKTNQTVFIRNKY